MRRICRENSKYAPNESFVAIFVLAERLPTSATLYMPKYKWSDFWHSRAGGSGVVHEVLGDLKSEKRNESVDTVLRDISTFSGLQTTV